MTFGAYQNPTYANAPGAEVSRVLGGVGTLALGSAGGFAITARIGLASLGFGGGAAAAGNAFVEGGGCFTEGTPIQMADGTTRPIEQIQAGDLVMSRSQSAGPNGAIEGKHVLRAYHLRVGHTVLLTLSSGEVLETTENHPFFVYGAGWVKAGKLSIGNLLVPRAGPTASAVTVTGIARKAGPTTVYNFTVQDDHSYFVGTTEGGTWVHNGPGDCTDLASLGRDALKEILYETPDTVNQLRQFFGNANTPPDPSVGQNISIQSLLAYQELAQRIIDQGSDSTGVQAARILQIIEHLAGR